jgi:hypothetical protein
VEDKTVLGWLCTPPPQVPPVLTVERSTTSKYQFYLTVRHFRQKLRRKPRFFVFSKQEADTAKAIIEEHSVFDMDGAFYVLEGFSRRFVDRLHPAPNTYVLAETDGGELTESYYAPYRDSFRAILKVLMEQLHLARTANWTLSGLLAQDWTGFRTFEQYEPVLRRGMLLQQTEDELGIALNQYSRVDLLELTKRGGQDFKVIMELEATAPQLAHHQLLTSLSRLLHFRALASLGTDDPKKLSEILEVSINQVRHLSKSHDILTDDDLQKLTERTIALDPLMFRNPKLGLELFYLNNPISVRRR